VKRRAPARTLDDTTTEHDKKALTSRSSPDPSNPQGPFWRPEDAYRNEAFRNLHIPGLTDIDEPRPTR
jgi:hypothetical protein